MAKQSAHDSCIMVLFGATGDLAHRKIIPAIYHLLKKDELPSGFALVAVARKPYTNETYRAEALEFIKANLPYVAIDMDLWAAISERIFYFQAEFSNDAPYDDLKNFLSDLDARYGTLGNRVFYLATPPDIFSEIAFHLKRHGLVQTETERPWHRVVFEKPFGNDLASAKELNSTLSMVFTEKQIYRIDHFLGKELVQNVIVLRFANGLFEPLWNRRYIDHVQISALETIGVGSRGGYYDTSGALKDMVQNHLLQLLALVAMEAPITLDSDDIRNEKVKVLRALRPSNPDDIQSVRGQYIDGTLNGENAVAYRDEEKVSKDSQTETFVALRVEIQNGRWQGVPFYLRTGKRMGKNAMEITVQFNKTPYPIFQGIALDANRLVIRIQPEEGITVFFNGKIPGTELRVLPVRMNFSQTAAFGPNTPEAYERLLHDVMLGDTTLFTRWDEVENAWVLVDRVIESWKLKNTPLLFYAPGSYGPVEADNLLAHSGHKWILPLEPDPK